LYCPRNIVVNQVVIDPGIWNSDIPIDPGWNSLRNPRCAETSIPRRWGLPGCHWYNDQWKMSGRYKTRWERHTTLSCLSIIQLLMITPFECIL
jgi:hypothetical protein